MKNSEHSAEWMSMREDGLIKPEEGAMVGDFVVVVDFYRGKQHRHDSFFVETKEVAERVAAWWKRRHVRACLIAKVEALVVQPPIDHSSYYE